MGFQSSQCSECNPSCAAGNVCLLAGICAGKGSPLGCRLELSHCTSSFVLALSGLLYMPLHPATAQLLEYFPSKSYWERGLKKLCRDVCISSAGRDTKQSGVTNAFPQRRAGDWWSWGWCLGAVAPSGTASPPMVCCSGTDSQRYQPVQTGNNKRSKQKLVSRGLNILTERR